MHTYMYTHIHIHVHTYIQIHMHTYIYTHIHICIYAHTKEVQKKTFTSLRGFWSLREGDE